MNVLYIDNTDGWSLKGTPARLTASAKHIKKWSILPLYTYDGFIDWKIIHGSFDGDLFVQFLEEHVIPHTNPFPGIRSVLIMDNAKIHHDEI
jgi:DDE superfamily endonuclease